MVRFVSCVQITSSQKRCVIDLPPAGVPVEITDYDGVLWRDCPNRRLVALIAEGCDEARRQKLDGLTQLPKSLVDERIGRRYGRIGHADVHGGQAQQLMLEAVPGQDDHRSLRRKPKFQQVSADRPHMGERLRVAQSLPVAAGGSSRHESAIGNPLGPGSQAIRQPQRVGIRRASRHEQSGAVRADY